MTEEIDIPPTLLVRVDALIDCRLVRLVVVERKTAVAFAIARRRRASKREQPAPERRGRAYGLVFRRISGLPEPAVPGGQFGIVPGPYMIFVTKSSTKFVS